MTKHTDDVAPATSEVHSEQFPPDSMDNLLTPEKPKRRGEHTTQTPLRPRSASGKRKSIAADISQGAGQKDAARAQTKTEIVLKKLRSAKGVTLAQLGEATGWQVHSVRSFLSAVVRKKLGLNLMSAVGKDGVRRYRIDGDTGIAA